MDLVLFAYFGLEFGELLDLKNGMPMGTFLSGAAVRALNCVLKHI